METNLPSDRSGDSGAAHWQRVDVLLNQALDLPPERRTAFLREVHASEPAVYAQLKALLAADAEAGSFLEASGGQPLARLFDDWYGQMQGHEAGMPATQTIGSYRLLEEVGRGGMGVVYKACDTRLDRYVALKFMQRWSPIHTKSLARFTAEAKAASALDHINICTIHEIGETEGGATFIAMAYYEGETLRAYIDRAPLSVAACLSIAEQIARGLSHAHSRGITHRDIKPGNVMVTKEGVVKLLDFGLAKLAQSTVTSNTALRLGTAAYAAPERIRGEEIDHRVDLWSFGVVLYEMLTGEHPFAGDTMAAVLHAVLEQDAPPITTVRPEVPEALARIIDTLLQKQPDERYAHAEEALADLRRLQAPTPALCHRSVSNKQGVLWATASLLLLVVALAMFWLSPGAKPTESHAAVAILPFSIHGSEDRTYLREGLVDLLSTKLDGVAGLRSIDPHALLGYVARWSDEPVDPQRGQEVAAHFGASHFILGSVVDINGELQLTASLYDAHGTEQTRTQATVTDETRFVNGVDDLAQELVASQLEDPGEQLASLAAMTTPSFSALQAYLEGERHLRDGRFKAAVHVLERAVTLDSTFALAWYRLARAAGWVGQIGLNMHAIHNAVEYGHSLPDRTRALVEAYYIFRNGDPEEAEQHYRAILASYPDDAETWYLLGEVLFHNNPFYGRSITEAREPLERALASNPESREIRAHLIDIAAREQRWSALNALMDDYLRPTAEGEPLDVWHAYRALQGWALGDSLQRGATVMALEKAGPEAIYSTLTRIAPLLEDKTLVARLSGSLKASGRSVRWQAAGALHQADLAVAGGQWQTAQALYDRADSIGVGLGQIHQVLAYTLPFAPIDRSQLEALRAEVSRPATPPYPGSADEAHQEEAAAVNAYLLGLLSWKLCDDDAVRRHISQLQALVSGQEGGRLAHAFARSLEALVAWQRNHHERALSALDQAQLRMPFHQRSQSPLYEQHLNRYVRAEVLYALQRYDEAERWYASLNDGYGHDGLAYLAPSYLRRAEIYEHQGKPEQALLYYDRFLETWNDIDPALHPWVAQVYRQQERLSNTPCLLNPEACASSLLAQGRVQFPQPAMCMTSAEQGDS